MGTIRVKGIDENRRTGKSFATARWEIEFDEQLIEKVFDHPLGELKDLLKELLETYLDRKPGENRQFSGRGSKNWSYAESQMREPPAESQMPDNLAS